MSGTLHDFTTHTLNEFFLLFVALSSDSFPSSEEMEVARAELSRRAGQLRSKGQSLQQTCVQEVEVTVAGLEKEVADSLKKMQKKLPNMIRDYSHSTDNGGQFVPEQVAVYQQHLCEHLDNEIGQDVESLFDRTLARRYEGTREHLICKTCEGVLGLMAANTKDHLNYMSLMNSGLDLHMNDLISTATLIRYIHCNMSFIRRSSVY